MADERVSRKFETLFGRAADSDGLESELSDGRLRPKVMAYGLTFAEQFLGLGRVEVAAMLLHAFCTARQRSGLPDDRRALALRTEVLAAQVEARRIAYERLRAGTDALSRRGVNEAKQ
eukprot:1246423-Prymnesium_polylepis.1